MMDRRMDKQLVKQRKAAYDEFNRYEVEERRRETFADRLSALTDILRFGAAMKVRPQPLYDEAILRRWNRIREHYE